MRIADEKYVSFTTYRRSGEAAAILTTRMLAAGLLMRDRRGIGFEGVAIPLVYVLAIVGVAYLG